MPSLVTLWCGLLWGGDLSSDARNRCVMILEFEGDESFAFEVQVRNPWWERSTFQSGRDCTVCSL